jgi:glycosyltransferase involved in cell wall biosynthesis
MTENKLNKATKKIVHLIFTLEVGGSENLLVDIANEQSLNTDVTIILINSKFDPELISRINPRVHFYSLKREEGNRRSIRFLLHLWAILLQKRPDVLHCHNHQIIRLLPYYKQRAVLTVHCVTIPSLNFGKYKKVYSVSQTVASEVKKRSGIISPVVINGINFNDIVCKSVGIPGKGMTASVSTLRHSPFVAKYKNNTKTNFDAAVQLAETKSHELFADKRFVIRLVQIARLKHEMKGQDILLTAIRHLLDASSIFTFTVDFIGSGKSEFYLRSMTTELGLDDFVSFQGSKPRTWIYSNLHGYDILVHPSRYEAFGLAMVEGIAAGLPVIASNAPGPLETLSDKPTGQFFRSGDAGDLARVIQNVSTQLVAGSIQPMCEISRSIANEQYSVQQTAKEYIRHYSNDLTNKHQG